MQCRRGLALTKFAETALAPNIMLYSGTGNANNCTTTHTMMVHKQKKKIKMYKNVQFKWLLVSQNG